MKVTVCLNPLHTALAPYGCALGYTRFSDVMRDAEMLKLVRQVGPAEGMAVVKDPGILSPKAFIEECINVRFPNEYIPDTPQRIAVDTSQMVGIRFGETIKEYIARDGSAEKLVGIPLAIAGWLRYLLAVDENGNAYELSPDPMNEELQEMLKDIEIGKPETLRDQLKPILSNARIFGSDLYEAGIGELIEDMFRCEISEFGGIRKTIIKYLG
jgi:fructuronate reductase